MDLIREEVTLVSLGGDSHIKFNFQEKKNYHLIFIVVSISAGAKPLV